MTSEATSCSTPKPKRSGFTIIEFVISVAVCTVLILLAGPSISGMLQQRQVKETSADIFHSLTVAQIEAARRHSTVRLCPSSDGMSCRNDGDWNKGWMVFADGNGNNKPDRIEIIESFDPPNNQIQIKANGAFAGEIAFTLAGIVASNNATTGAFTICPAKAGADSRVVMLDQDGVLQRVRTENGCDSG